MKFIKKVSKYWAEITIVLIFLLSIYVRLVGFHYPYLRNIDSYFFYRQMKYIYEHGHLPTIDHLMLAPTGMKISHDTALYPYLGAYTFKLMKQFFPNLELWRFLIYFPVIISSLSAFFLYIGGKNLYDKKAGLLFSFLMMFNPQMMARTLGGDPDSDCIVFFMTALTFMAVSYVIKYKYNFRKMVKASIFAGASFALFAYAWVGYWYLYWIMIGYMILLLGFEYAKSKVKKHAFSYTHAKRIGISWLIITLTIFLIGFPHFGTRIISSTIMSPFRTISIFSSSGGIKGEEGQFPNVYVSVAEMMSPGGVGKIIRMDPTMFFLTFLAIIYLFVAYVKYGRHIDTLSILISWLAVTMYASITAVRFTILLAMPITLGSGIILSKIFRLLLGEDKHAFE